MWTPAQASTDNVAEAAPAQLSRAVVEAWGRVPARPQAGSVRKIRLRCRTQRGKSYHTGGRMWIKNLGFYFARLIFL